MRILVNLFLIKKICISLEEMLHYSRTRLIGSLIRVYPSSTFTTPQIPKHTITVYPGSSHLESGSTKMATMTPLRMEKTRKTEARM